MKVLKGTLENVELNSTYERLGKLRVCVHWGVCFFFPEFFRRREKMRSNFSAATSRAASQSDSGFPLGFYKGFLQVHTSIQSTRALLRILLCDHRGHLLGFLSQSSGFCSLNAQKTRGSRLVCQKLVRKGTRSPSCRLDARLWRSFVFAHFLSLKKKNPVSFFHTFWLREVNLEGY